MSVFWPNELLSQVFNYLKEDQATLAQLTLTSKQFRLVALPFLYYAPQWTRLSQIELFASVLNDNTGLMVHRIDLHMVSHRWQASASMLHHLRLITQKTPHLEWLNLDYCARLTNMVFREMTAPLHDLRILSVASCSLVGDDAMIDLPKHNPYLQEIYLGSTQVSDQTLELLTQMKLLTHVSLKDCQQVTERGVEILMNLKTLKSLDIEDCYNVLGDHPIPVIVDDEIDDLWIDIDE
ncbi:F-box/LRR-repeat protein 7 [Choanephora cucurbitarum]|uniref:F-box/LRR-repeat protein 7 n=1 Tax=Choanephora cucurbitarum TaxID=101091 RepID=A0A1C7NF95_9FUNG|nr:F-box/LRR-repeat protein 7 [Choanephora cucurbitarum]